MRAGSFLILVCTAAVLSGCYAMRPSEGGGKASFDPPRRYQAADVAVPAGYRVELVAEGFTFPTGVTFDDQGGIYVTESGYSYGEVFTTPRLLRVVPGGAPAVVAEGGRNGPWTAATFHRGAFFVAEGGQMEGGRILRIERDGRSRALVDGLPSTGDHHTNGVVAGPDGWLYFGQGTATNAAVVGTDNAKFGWLKRFPQFHDTPCRDLTLTGANVTTDNPLGSGDATTGAFQPFGTASTAGQVVRGGFPCNGAVMRVPPDGGRAELVAWGFRNPFGLAFAPDGRLYVTDNSYDVRGSRPVFGAGDLLWAVQPGAWHGWPDFHGDTPLYEGERYRAPGKPAPPRLLAQHPNRPPRPAAVLGVHSSSNGFDVSRNPAFGHVGQAFVAQFGDMTSETGKVMAPVGFRVVRVDPATGTVTDFMLNRGGTPGPASYMNNGGIERPTAARFDPSGSALYVVDFGVMTMGAQGPQPKPGTGALWRIVPAR